MNKKNIIITIISVLILTCLFVSTASAYIDIPLGAFTTTDLELVKPEWTDEEDIIDDLNTNWDILEAFANDPLEFDTGTRLEDRVDVVLSTWAGDTDITTLGTVTTGVWQGTAIVDAYISDTLTVTGYMQDEDINTFSELQSWVTDQTLIHSGVTTLSSLVSVGTIGTGVWQGTAIADGYIPNNITIDLATLASTVTVDATTTDTTCFVGIFESASGSLEPQTDATLIYNANTGLLTSTAILINGTTAKGIEITGANTTAQLYIGGSNILANGEQAIYVNCPSEDGATNAMWLTLGSTVVTGDCTGARIKVTTNATTGGGAASGQNVRGVYAQAIAAASDDAGLLQGGLFVADVSAGSCVAYNVHVLCGHYSAGASTVIAGDLYVGYLRAQSRSTNARTVTGHDCLLALENEAVEGTGQVMDSAIRIFDTNVSGDAFTYGIDMNDATLTTDIRLSNAHTITDSATGVAVSLLSPTTISGLSDVTSADADYILIWDATDSVLKKVDMGEVRGAGFTTFSQFDEETNWRVYYSDGSGDITELALGADGTYLKSNGAAAAPTFATPAGAGDVVKVGTPVDSQVGVWTGDGTIEGVATLTYDGSNLQLTGDIGATGSRITKGWFANLETTGDLTVNGTALASIYANLGVNSDITSMTGLDNDGIPLAKVDSATSLPIGVVASFFVSCSSTPFDADIAGNPTATSVVYDGDTLEGSINFIAVNNNLTNCRVVLYNTTRGNSRFIASVDIATDTITTESSTDDWADNDVITTQSTTCGEAGYVDLDFSTGDALPTNATGILINGYVYDDAAVGNNAMSRFHPYAAFDSEKRSDAFVQVAGLSSHYGSLLMPITSRRFCYQTIASGATSGRLKMVFVGYTKE